MMRACIAVSPPTAWGFLRAASPNNSKFWTVSGFASSALSTSRLPHKLTCLSFFLFFSPPCRSCESGHSDSRSCRFCHTRPLLLHLCVSLQTSRLLQEWVLWWVSSSFLCCIYSQIWYIMWKWRWIIKMQHLFLILFSYKKVLNLKLRITE